MKNSARLKFSISSVLVFFALLLVWRLIILAFAVPAYMLPTPWMVGKAMLARFPELIQAFLLSAEAAGGGLVASFIVGIAISLIFAGLPWVRKLLVPYTILLQTVPIVAISPLIVMWIGPGLPAVMLIAFVICLAPIIANTTQGLVNVDENLLQLFVMHNASGADVLRKLRLPNSLPYMFVGMRISSGIAVIGAITGELFAGSSRVGQGGLGYSILYAQSQGEIAYLFGLVIAATVLGFSFFFTVMFFEWLFLHKWHESAVSRES